MNEFLNLNDEELILDLLPDYIENRQKDLDKMLELIDQGLFSEVRSIAHKIKGHALNYGLPVLDLAMAQIQHAKDQELDPKKIKSELLELKINLAKAQEIVQTRLKKL